MKRRCAGCHAVIEGRPNKLYCSPQCRWRVGKSAEKSSAGSGPVRSVIRGSNGVLIAKVARLGYLGGADVDGARRDLRARLVVDSLPAGPCPRSLGDGDFRDRPEADGSCRVVVLRPALHLDRQPRDVVGRRPLRPVRARRD